jgi:thiamine monophosphate synthase
MRMASYLVAGTVLPSESKPHDSGVLGWAGLAELTRAAGQTPVLAIGGLAADKVGDVIRAGATGVAGIGCFLPESGEDVASGVQQRVRDMIRAFDSAGG